MGARTERGRPWSVAVVVPARGPAWPRRRHDRRHRHRAHGPSPRARRVGAGVDAAEPVGRLRDRGRRRHRVRGRHRSRRRPARRGGGPRRRPAATTSRGATAWVTLEPCSHHGRTPPCADALIAAGVGRVVVAIEDPDPQRGGPGHRPAAGGGHRRRGRACGATAAAALLAPYLHHRRTGRPYVVLKLAASLDGRTAAPDGTSQWITGPEARADAHRLRAESDAVLVGAGTVRADDPSLTVRDAPAPRGDPLRVVLGAGARRTPRCDPCLEHHGDLGELLDQLGAKGHLQLLVEGGATVAHAFHEAGPRRPLRALPRARALRRRRRPRPVRRPRRRRRSTTCGAVASAPSPASATTCASTSTRGDALMFTGIVEELGTVVSREGPRLRIAAHDRARRRRAGRVDRRQRHLPHRRRLGRRRRAGGRPTSSTRPTPAPPSARSSPATR